MPELSFVFGDHAVRVVFDATGEPWWVGADVCAALGIANSRDALATLESDEKGVGYTDTLGGRQSVTTINEPGLYRLIFASRKPAAAAFKRWVLHEVLPTIRRTGGFQVASSAEVDPPVTAEYWLAVVREARLTHGRRAAARLWRESPLPPVEAEAALVAGPDAACAEFLSDCCVLTGGSDFLLSRTLLSAYARWCDANGEGWPGNRAAANVLRRVARTYVDPDTGGRMRPVKRSNTGYLGVRLRHPLPFD